MSGAALVYGALARLIRRAKVTDAIIFAIGLGVLANSRPFEGFVISLPAFVVLVRQLLKQGVKSRLGIASGAAACGLIVIVMAMMHYNRQLTGHPLKLPYMHHEELYAVAPSFLWQDVRSEPHYRHETIRRVHAEWETEAYQFGDSFNSAAQWYLWKLQILWNFFLGQPLTIPLVALPFALKCRWTRLAAIASTILILVFAMHTYMQPHYAAPLTALTIAVVVQSMRHLRVFRFGGWPVGRFLVRGTLIIYVLSFIPFAQDLHNFYARYEDPQQIAHCFRQSGGMGQTDYLFASSAIRKSILDRLEQTSQSHVIIVRYGKAHDPLFEWVYNEANIDAAQVVWAHDMGAARNTELLNYFHDRQFWMLRIDGRFPEIRPYRKGKSASPTKVDHPAETVQAENRKLPNIGDST